MTGDGRSREITEWARANCPTYHGAAIEVAWQSAYTLWLQDRSAGHEAAWKLSLPFLLSLSADRRRDMRVQDLMDVAYDVMKGTLSRYNPSKGVGLSYYWQKRLLGRISAMASKQNRHDDPKKTRRFDDVCGGGWGPSRSVADEDYTGHLAYSQGVQHIDDLSDYDGSTTQRVLEEVRIEGGTDQVGVIVKMYVSAYQMGTDRPSVQAIAKKLGVTQEEVPPLVREAVSRAMRVL